jgi:pimeloyl-ACP methyl ester carboxylesterase
MQRHQHLVRSAICAPVPDPSAGRTRPFRVHVEQSVLDDLQQRLDRTRWTRRVEGSGWSHGTDSAYLRDLVSYWRTGYDWQYHEVRLNAHPHLIARVEGEDLHVIMTSRRSRATPLLLLHGWPDSFYRYHKVIPTLSALTGGDPGDAFDVVVPSLPGFPLTGPLRYLPREQPTRHAAHLIWKLMTNVLGFDRFAVAGGDGGGVIAQILAIDHPESVIGIHLTDLGWHAMQADPAPLSRPEQKYLADVNQQFMSDGAYARIQATRPRSLAPGLSDSPAGLASWIVDRFHAWCDGDLDSAFSKDDLLTNIMLYWVTQTIGSSVQSYFAEARSPSLTPADHVDCPVGVALFPADIGGIPPRQLAERTLNVQRWTEMPCGGHFAALEEPELYARDVIAFFQALRGGGAAHEPQE